MKRDDNGYIVVETIGTFIPFVLLMISILSLVNIVVVQARVHYAMTQAAQTLSMYSYTLEVTGLAEHMQNSAGQADTVQTGAKEFQENLSGIMEGMESLSPDQVGTHGNAALDQVNGWVENTVSDPMNTVRLLLNYGLGEAGKQVTEQLVRPLVGRYLRNGDMSGDEFLRAFQVIGGLDGLDFADFSLTDFNANDSMLLDAGGDVKIVVRYDIDYTFGALPLPFDPKLSITQTVQTKSWLGGSGEGYKE